MSHPYPNTTSNIQYMMSTLVSNTCVCGSCKQVQEKLKKLVFLTFTGRVYAYDLQVLVPFHVLCKHSTHRSYLHSVRLFIFHCSRANYVVWNSSHAVESWSNVYHHGCTIVEKVNVLDSCMNVVYPLRIPLWGPTLCYPVHQIWSNFLHMFIRGTNYKL